MRNNNAQIIADYIDILSSDRIDRSIINDLKMVESDAEDLICIYDSCYNIKTNDFSRDELRMINKVFNELQKDFFEYKVKRVNPYAEVSIYRNYDNPKWYFVKYKDKTGPSIFVNDTRDFFDKLMRIANNV